MTPHDLEREVLDVFRNFWRIRAALTFLRQEASAGISALKALEIHFDNVPSCSATSHIFGNETLDTALSGIELFEQDRLRNDVLLAMISRLEMYLSDRLVAAGSLPVDATFGRLQRVCEAMVAVPQAQIDALDEVRERRNAIIHHRGVATTRYLLAAAKVPTVTAVSAGSIIITDDAYLSYAVDSLVSYGRCIP